jgi:hypothetical protein
MRKNGIRVGIIAVGLIVCSAGAASAGDDRGDDKGDEGKGAGDVACVVVADGHNTVKKLALEEKYVDEVLKFGDTMRYVGEGHLCTYYDIDKFTIGVKTEGEVKTPEVVYRVKGHSTGSGVLSELLCNVIGNVLDQLNTQADNLQGQGQFSQAAAVLETAEQIQDAGLNGGCFFIY